MAKRILAIALSMVLCFSMLQLHVFAADNDQVMDGYYILDENGSIVNTTNAHSHTANDFTVSKTIAQTGENAFEITLQVETSQTVVTNASAIQLVIDRSNSMEYCSACGSTKPYSCGCDAGTRMSAVKSAITGENGFLDSLLSGNQGDIYLSIVVFSGSKNDSGVKDAKTVLEWTELTAETKSSIAQVVNGINSNGGTNLDAGLTLAANRLQMSAIEACSNKYTVLLTDGAPTYYTDSNETSTTEITDTEGSGSSASENTINGGQAAATAVKAHSTLYTICFGVSNENLQESEEFCAHCEDEKHDHVKLCTKCLKPRNEHYKGMSGSRYCSYGSFQKYQEGYFCDATGSQPYTPAATPPLTVGQYLSGSIATSANTAYNANDLEDVYTAFSNIASSATSGSTGSGTTVTDPMGQYIVLGDVSGKAGVSASGNTLTWNLDSNTLLNTSASGNTTTYTYQIKYPITLNTAGDGFQEKNEDGSTKYYPANGYTYLSVPTANGTVKVPFNIPAVCGELPIYSVSYEYTGNVPSVAPAVPSSADYKKNSTVTVADEPSLANYTFSGWTTTDAAVNADGTFQMPGNNVILVGSWTEHDKYLYTLTYDGNGGALANNDVSYNDAQSIAAPGTYATSHTFDVDSNTFVRENFAFIGWSTEPNGEVISDEQIVLTFDNNTEVLYAQWEAIPYTVSYEYEGSVPANAPELPADATQFAGDLVTIADDSTLANYTFTGWHTQSGDPVITITDSDTSFTMPGANVTLFGSWVEHNKYLYTLTYDGNGGVLANSDIAYDDAQSIAAPGTYATSHTFDVDSNTFVRENFAFIGWSTEPNGEVISDEQIVLTAANNTEVLYAQWEAIPYTVSYEYVGTTVPAAAPALPADATQFAGDTVTVAVAPELVNYTFSGWTTSDATVDTDGTFQMPGKNVKLVGSWTENPKYDYSVIYNANFGTDPETKADIENIVDTYADTYTIYVDENSFERANYTFAGWSSTPNGEVEFNTDDAIQFNNGGSKTLYAQWIEHNKYSYTVVYNGNGGALVNSEIAYGDAENVVGTYATSHEVEVDENTFIRKNYTFTGWNTEADGSGIAYAAEDIIALTAEDNTETLYAQWSINSYEFVVNYMTKVDDADYAPFSGNLPQGAPTGGSAVYGTVIDEEVLNVPAELTDDAYTYTYVSLDGVQISDGENVVTVYYSYTTPPVEPEEEPVIPPVTEPEEEDVPPMIEIEEEEVPLAPPPVIEIVEEEVPLAPPPVIEIVDEEVPLANVPKTGDLTVFYYGLTALSGAGLAALGLKKKKEDAE